jgi:hypothetical protein
MKRRVMIFGFFLAMMLGAANINASEVACSRFRISCGDQGGIGITCGTMKQRLEDFDFYMDLWC